MRKIVLSIVCLFLILNCIAQKPLRVAVAGMKHDHILGLLNQFKNGEVVIIGFAEADEQLVNRYKKSHHLPDSLFFKSLSE